MKKKETNVNQVILYHKEKSWKITSKFPFLRHLKFDKQPVTYGGVVQLVASGRTVNCSVVSNELLKTNATNENAIAKQNCSRLQGPASE